MFVPGENMSSERLTDYFGEYHLAMLSANPEMRGLAEAFQPLQEALRAANEAERKADRAVTHALAGRNYADFALDRAVRQFFFEVLARNNNNRESAEVKKLFPNGLDAIVSSPIEKEMGEIEALEARMADKNDKLFATHRPAISKARTALKKAGEGLVAAITAHGSAYGIERAKRVDWVRQYTSSYGALVNQLGRKTDAEVFFRRPDRSGTEETAPEPAAPAAAQ